MVTAQATGIVPPWTLADRMRKSRDWAGLDQRELAEQLGIVRQSVSNYESGRTRPGSRIVLREWARVTGVDYHWLVYGQGEIDAALPRKDSNLQPAGYSPSRDSDRDSAPTDVIMSFRKQLAGSPIGQPVTAR